MDKIWVRNILIGDIDRIGSLSFGSDDWQEAYSEMIQRGYKFKIGDSRGDVMGYCGLYLINPLDIQIKPSEYDVVNRLNKDIAKLQESTNVVKLAEEKYFPWMSHLMS